MTSMSSSYTHGRDHANSVKASETSYTVINKLEAKTRIKLKAVNLRPPLPTLQRTVLHISTIWGMTWHGLSNGEPIKATIDGVSEDANESEKRGKLTSSRSLPRIDDGSVPL